VDDDSFDGFEWDAAKSAATFADRGIDFAFAAQIFDGPYLQWSDQRQDYGEPRYLATGQVAGIAVTVAWTPRGHRRRIITAWPATAKEEHAYHEHRKEIKSTSSESEG
jgi:uncharacterized protein